jgi:hypothetical protein
MRLAQYILSATILLQYCYAQTSTPPLKKLNIDFMNRGYFYAYSTVSKKNPQESGGWAVSDNQPQQIQTQSFPQNQFSVFIDTTKKDSFSLLYEGFSVFVVNTTRDTIKLSAQDSRLYMKVQALNKDQQWKDIEYLPSSWCGNSYHVLELEPNAFWKFVMPAYEGKRKTKLRICLQYLDSNDPHKQLIVFSNTIDGAINEGQFKNIRDYNPKGIMDPYDN